MIRVVVKSLSITDLDADNRFDEDRSSKKNMQLIIVKSTASKPLMFMFHTLM